MKDNWVEIVGFTAAVLTTVAYLPQTLKTIKTKKTDDISLGMYLLMLTGVVAWLVYGIKLNSYPMMMANSITLSLVIIILVLKIRYK